MRPTNTIPPRWPRASSAANACCALRHAMLRSQRRLEFGQVLLASIGSTAPFVGLLGTVWGIYHALGSIAVSGQAQIENVAGPVGEALIMTAFGLVVAIPRCSRTTSSGGWCASSPRNSTLRARPARVRVRATRGRPAQPA
jgi:biopolymer transport protein ExbB